MSTCMHGLAACVVAICAGAAVAGEHVAASDGLAPLVEIGRVKATSAFCRASLEHATQAATLAIDNDRKIDVVVRTLRSADFDANALSKSRALQTLTNEYAPLAEQSSRAARAAAALRNDERSAPNAARAAALAAFGDALDGAIQRQRKIVRSVSAFIPIANQRAPQTEMEHEQAKVDAQLADTVRGTVTHDDPAKLAPPLLSSIAHDGAEDIAIRQLDVTRDERTAAALVNDTFGNC